MVPSLNKLSRPVQVVRRPYVARALRYLRFTLPDLPDLRSAEVDLHEVACARDGSEPQHDGAVLRVLDFSRPRYGSYMLPVAMLERKVMRCGAGDDATLGREQHFLRYIAYSRTIGGEEAPT